MTPQETFRSIAAQKDGPVKKFQLVKVFRPLLPENVQTLSCAQIEKTLAERLSVR